MRKTKFLSITIVLILFASTACGGQGNRGGATPVGTGTSASGLPAATLLPLGTLLLEGTDQAVTAEQAAQLLPLWKAARSLATSDGAAVQEVTAIYKQISETMTAEQLKAMNNLSKEDVAAYAGKQGLSLGMANAGGASQRTGQTSGAAMAAGPSGGMVGMLSGGGGPRFVESGSNSQNNSNSRSSSTSKTHLFDLVIELLKGKI